MTRRVCGAFRQGGILIALLGLLLNMGRSAFAADVFQIEWVVVQGIACVDANGNATCSPNEVAVPKVQVRSDGTVLATTDSTGRFSVRVPAQTVIEFELPAGYESATGELITQVFESGRLDVPLTQQVVATATAVKPAGTAIKPTATTRAKATATVVATATKQNTPTPTLTVTPEPSPAKVPPTLTASAIPPTEAPSTETPAATEAAATRQTLATATATLAPTETALPQPTETITTLVVIAAGDVPTAPPDVSATPINASPAPLPSFEEEAQSASQSGPEFSLGAIPQAYFVSGGLSVGSGFVDWAVCVSLKCAQDQWFSGCIGGRKLCGGFTRCDVGSRFITTYPSNTSGAANTSHTHICHWQRMAPHCSAPVESCAPEDYFDRRRGGHSGGHYGACAGVCVGGVGWVSLGVYD